MKLEEYLDGVEKCADELIILNGFDHKIHKLSIDYGIYDNFQILLKTNFNELLKKLQDSSFYSLENFYRPSDNILENKNYWLNYTSNGCKLQLKNFIYNIASIKKEILKEGGYNSTIIIHSKDKDNDPVSWAKTIKPVVKNLGEYVMKNQIPSCFTPSFHEKESINIFYP